MKISTAKCSWTLIAAAAMLISLASCGGGSPGPSSFQPPPSPPPPPQIAITTTTLPPSVYSEFYSATLEASGGVGARTWTISSGDLPDGLSLDHGRGVISGVVSEEITGTGLFEVTVRDSGTGVATRGFALIVDRRVARILTTTLPDAVLGRHYRVRLATTQPDASMSFHPTEGTPPPGIAFGFPLSPPQTLEGTPTTAGTFTFTVQMFTTQVVAERTFTLRVVGPGAANRNEDVTNAPLVSNGTYFASISPFVDPATNVVANPDHDFYRLTAQSGSIVSVEITADRLGRPLDSVIELVDSSGARLTTCDVPGQTGFTTSCMNDDNAEADTLDSKLLFRAPAGAPTTFFLHVLDWRGDSRPDMAYSFQVFGVD